MPSVLCSCTAAIRQLSLGRPRRLCPFQRGRHHDRSRRTCWYSTPQPGDLARRVAHRRAELGMTVEDLAERCGIDPDIPRVLRAERRLLASAPAHWVFLRWRWALQSSSFREARWTAHPGWDGPDVIRSLEILTREQCEAHLEVGGIGRVVFTSERGPVAVPVNFEYSEGTNRTEHRYKESGCP